MYTVDESFLKEEELEGFLVPEMMKRAWAAMIKVLMEIDRVCKKHDIRYFASYGTLLGTIRHKGFIPWDDDMDISILRPDYMKFLSVAHEIQAPYRVKSLYAPEGFSQFLTVVSNSRQRKLAWDEQRVKDFFGCPYIVAVDVCPFDYAPADPDMRRLIQLLYYMGYSLVKDYDQKRVTPEFRQILTQFGSRTGVKLELDDPEFVNKAMRAADQLAMWCKEEDADSVCYFPQMAYMEQATLLPKEWFRETVNLPFENIEIPVPIDYEKVLEYTYGTSYMTPVRGAAAHNYPFYAGQEEYFRFTGDLEKLN